MKLKNLLQQYKAIAKEMKILAKRHQYLYKAVRTNSSKKLFAEYQETCKKLHELNGKAYNIMYQYRTIAGSPLYKVLFACRIIKKQNTFRFVDPTKNYGWFNYNQMINLVNMY